MVERVLELSRAARERPSGDDYYTSVIRQAYPDMPVETARAISMVCVHRMVHGYHG